MRLSRGPVVTGRQIEKILGHYIADGMHRRESLSVPRALYDLIRAACFCANSAVGVLQNRGLHCWIYHATVLQWFYEGVDREGDSS